MSLKKKNTLVFGMLVIVALTLQGCSLMPPTGDNVTPANTNESTQTDTGNMPSSSTGDDKNNPDAANQSASLNGTFHLTDTYQTHAGPEDMDATVTIENDVITAVSAKNVAVLPMSKRLQDEFIEGIAGQVVGKNIKDVNVTKVNGSSLTAQSFNKALHALKNN